MPQKPPRGAMRDKAERHWITGLTCAFCYCQCSPKEIFSIDFYQSGREGGGEVER